MQAAAAGWGFDAATEGAADCSGGGMELLVVIAVGGGRGEVAADADGGGGGGVAGAERTAGRSA